MTTFDTNSTTFGSTTVAARIIGSAFSAVATVKAWNHSRKTFIMLSSLTNRELDDIGLSRADIARVSRMR